MAQIPAHLRSIANHDGAVILDIPRDAMTTLNPTGAYVWERLQRGVQIGSIVRELAHETGADALVVAKDVDDFMQELKSKRLVTLP